MCIPFGSMPRDIRRKNLQGKRVLVVEAEGVTLMLLQSALRYAGARIVYVCHTATESILLASQEKPDLILIELPPNGAPEVAAAVRQLSKAERACVVIITASMSDQDEQQLRAAGAAGFVKKPFTVAELLPLMEETCGSRWTAASH